MAEFDMRMARAREMNAGKADAYSAGLLTREESYYFRAWSAYQLDLVRAIQREGFPDVVEWPDEPPPYEVVSAPVMDAYNERMQKAATFIDGKADAYAAGTLSAEERHNYQAWSEYAKQCTAALDRDIYPTPVVWPAEPEPYKEPPQPAPIPPSAPTTDPAPEAPTDPA